jgi:mRNA interferase RelE/StbE
MDPTYSKQAETFLAKQSEKQVARIKNAIHALPAGEVKKLRGFQNMYRLRVGDFRILFEKDGNSYHVIKIDNRGDVYK